MPPQSLYLAIDISLTPLFFVRSDLSQSLVSPAANGEGFLRSRRRGTPPQSLYLAIDSPLTPLFFVRSDLSQSLVSPAANGEGFLRSRRRGTPPQSLYLAYPSANSSTKTGTTITASGHCGVIRKSLWLCKTKSSILVANLPSYR
jgi:hypothetical protein